MKKVIFYFLFLLLCTSCNSTFQYDILVKNSTSSHIFISYENPNDKTEVTIQKIEIGKTFKLISLEETPKDKAMTQQEACDYFKKNAEIMKPNQKGEIKDCKQDVLFEYVDMGQGEYIIEFKDEN
ncbi:MAG: hypothetical protein ACPG5P_05230, partial [Saprospiraceae bacterium]